MFVKYIQALKLYRHCKSHHIERTKPVYTNTQTNW